jgi:hypothetical protein
LKARTLDLDQRLMEAKRTNGSPANLFVDPKGQTIVDVDFST